MSLQNFDDVLVPADHVSRNPNDTYYVDQNTVLRCHTSAHQAELLRAGNKAFLVTGAAPNAVSKKHLGSQMTIEWTFSLAQCHAKATLRMVWRNCSFLLNVYKCTLHCMFTAAQCSEASFKVS